MAFLIWGVLLMTGVVCAADERIIGGNPTTIQRHPAIVQVDTLFNNVFSRWCGGVIVTNTYVLTAAHCFPTPPQTPERIRIRAGSAHDNSGGVIRAVRRLLAHPTWRRNDYDGDIGLLQLASPLQFSNTISRARIPAQGAVTGQNQPVEIAGWGMTSFPDGPQSPVLREVSLTVFNHDLCRQRFAGIPRPRVITRNMICVGTTVPGRGACRGDSGGPTYHRGVVVGLVSFGHICADVRYPGVCTAVSSYTNWIVQNAV